MVNCNKFIINIFTLLLFQLHIYYGMGVMEVYIHSCIYNLCLPIKYTYTFMYVWMYTPTYTHKYTPQKICVSFVFSDNFGPWGTHYQVELLNLHFKILDMGQPGCRDPGRDPGDPGWSLMSGSLHGACFSLCLCLCLSPSMCVSHE